MLKNSIISVKFLFTQFEIREESIISLFHLYLDIIHKFCDNILPVQEKNCR